MTIPLTALHKRAQSMADYDGRNRYLNFTSMGWRIELSPLKDGLTKTVEPSRNLHPKEA